jgi:hypothetical protein
LFPKHIIKRWETKFEKYEFVYIPEITVKHIDYNYVRIIEDKEK